MRDIAHFLKVCLVVFGVTLSTYAGDREPRADTAINGEFILPAQIYSGDDQVSRHLLVKTPGVLFGVLSKVNLTLSSMLALMGDPVFLLPTSLAVLSQLAAHEIGLRSKAYVLTHPLEPWERAPKIRIPGLDFYRLRQVMVGRRDRIVHEGVAVTIEPRELHVRTENNKAVHIGVDVKFTKTDFHGEKTVETKIVPLQDIYFQGPAGSIGLCKTALTAIGLLR